MNEQTPKDIAMKQMADAMPFRTSTVIELQGGLVAQVELYNGQFNTVTMGVIGVQSRVDIQREGARKLRDLLNQVLPLTPAEIEALIPDSVAQELKR